MPADTNIVQQQLQRMMEQHVQRFERVMDTLGPGPDFVPETDVSDLDSDSDDTTHF